MVRLIVNIFVILLGTILVGSAMGFAQDLAPLESSFIDYSSKVDDRSNKLSDDDVASIELALTEQETDTGLKGFVLIVPEISGWDFDEYDFVRKQYDYWKTKGIVDTHSYIIIIAVENKKVNIAKGKFIEDNEDYASAVDLERALKSNLKSGNYASAILSYIEGIGSMSQWKTVEIDQDKLKGNAQWFMLIGILILTSVFMRMGWRRRLEEQRRQEQRNDIFKE